MDARSESSFGEGEISTRQNTQLLLRTGLKLASERDVTKIVRTSLEAGMQLAKSRIGALVYRGLDADGESYAFRDVWGLPRGELNALPVPHPDELVGEQDNLVIRTAALAADDEPSQSSSFAGIPWHELPFERFGVLAIRNGSGELLGALLLSAEEDTSSLEQAAPLLCTLAAQAAAAIENARLASGLQREIVLADATRSLQVETSRRLRQALDAGQLGTWSWDKTTDLLDLDERAAEILGADPKVPTTRTALRKRIVLSDDLPLTPENLNELAQSGEAYRSEYRTSSPAGERWVSTRGLPTWSDDGLTVTGMTGTVQDITAQKTQESVLRQTEKLAATGRMAATIAHEINNPLEAVTNLIYLSKTDPTVPGEVRHLLELADTELARVSQIAQQTLGFYRDTSHPVDIDLSGLLHGVVDLFSRKLQSRDIRIDLDIREDLHIFGLQGEVRQVFSNLMVNAIDASNKGVIRVRARPRQVLGVNGVAVMICDEGGGIPHAIRHKLFAPFFTTKQSIGTGLGLWVTRGIVEKSGGKVGFRSRIDPPTGTVFRVFLPSARYDSDISVPQTTILQ